MIEVGRERLNALSVLVDAVRAGRGDAAGVRRRQERRLAALVRYARTRSPYYRRLYAGLPADVRDPAVLPATSKRDLMAHFDDWVTDPAVTLEVIRRDLLADPDLVGATYLDRYRVMTTSGTTGEPAVLVHDRDSWLVLNIIARLRVRWAFASWRLVGRVLRRGIRVAVLFAGGGHYGGVVLAEGARRRAPFLARSVRVLSVLRPLPDLVAELNTFRPTVLSGYPSALALLASEQRAGRLRIRPLVALAAGEELTRARRTEIEDAWGCVLMEGYAATEVPGLATPCPEGTLHVNTDWYLIEPVDETGQPVPPGRTSYTALVTNLANRVQPVIRYDLGDRVRLGDGPCACGSPFPTVTVEGRTNDVLALPGVRGGVVSVLPLALETVVEETPGVHRFQLAQTADTVLSLRLEADPGADPAAVRVAVETALLAFLSAQGAALVEIDHDPAPPRPEPRSGKLRHVRSLVGTEPAA